MYVGAVIALAVIAGTVYGIWYLFLRPAGPAAVADATLPPVPSASAGATVKPLGSGGIAGTWNVDTAIGTFADVKDTSGNFVGYRVQEQLAGIGANVAVGRTPKVSGSLTIDGTKVTAVTITADLTALESDDGIATPAPQQRHPDEPVPDRDVQADVSDRPGLHPRRRQGDLGHGEWPADAPRRDEGRPDRAQGEAVRLDHRGLGSLPIAFADYAIEKPNSFKVLSIDDHGTMELQLFFSHA